MKLNQQSEISNQQFMRAALRMARRAEQHNDVPIGAVIVQGGKIIARGENQIQLKKNPTLHAEIVAINRACKKLNSKILDDCEIYVSLEPCAMCRTALALAHIKKIHFAAYDEKGGAGWKLNIAQDPEFADESSELLKSFFRGKRKN
jgi:tRNA(adenine34) deaminase